MGRPVRGEERDLIVGRKHERGRIVTTVLRGNYLAPAHFKSDDVIACSSGRRVIRGFRVRGARIMEIVCVDGDLQSMHRQEIRGGVSASFSAVHGVTGGDARRRVELNVWIR